MRLTTQRGAAPTFIPRKRMVGWFDPRILAMTGWQAVVAQVFGTYLDKREIEALLGKNERIHASSEAETVGVDFVADLGDAFDPTYAIAWHLAKQNLELHDGSESLVLPRGEYLIMGGDEVYPAPTRDRYVNQTVGPYGAALPPGSQPAPQLLALPGNHDWYDGLSLFIEEFCTEEAIGGWDLPQARSYFAIPLPHHWWLWGVDAGLGGHIDPPQKKYFERLDLATGDRIILCWAAPTWTQTRSRPGEHELLERFVREVVMEKHGASVPLYLSGDSHHFAHYRSRQEDVHWVTSGGGGAFLHPTHHLKRNMDLPARDGSLTQLELVGDPWPSAGESKRLLARLLLFPLKNPSFLLFTAALNLLLAWSVQFGLRGPEESFTTALKSVSMGDVWNGFVRNPVSIMLALLVIAGFFGFAKPPTKGRNLYRFAGAAHGTIQVAVALFLIWYVSGLFDGIASSLGFTIAFVAAIAVFGGVASGLLMGIYLLVTNLVWKMHDNEAFSALHYEGYKHFLRIRIDSTGLTLYVIGLEKVGRNWQADVPATAESPPCDDAGKVVPRCIDTITIATPARAAPSPPSN